MKKLLTCLLFVVFCIEALAQQDPQYSQYMYNPIVVNPAYAGNRGVASIMGLHRSQWVGLDGAPRTQTLSFHTPISNSSVGLGLSIVNDDIGPTNETYVTADFSYTLLVGEGARLSFGIKGGFHTLNVDFNRLNVFDTSDPTLNNIENKISPTVGLGLYYHTNNWYLGLSSPNLLQTEHFNENFNAATATYTSQERIHLFTMAGYVLDLNSNVKFKPATMVKVVFDAPVQVDLTANFLFDDQLTLGMAYRWGAAVTGLVGFQFTEQIMIGFAYDRETTVLGKTIFNDGSYEVFLRYELFQSYDRIVTPRFF